MENKLKCEKKIVIDAPVTKVWQALTTADIVKEYFFGNEAISTWNVGDSIMFKGEWEGQEYLGRGIIQNRVPYKLFRFSYWSSLSGLENKSENYLHISYHLLEDEDGNTELTTVVEKIQGEDMKLKIQKDLDKVLNSLKEVVETQIFEMA
jgi:uncharacterized protein YndB with AHSA1/START domain